MALDIKKILADGMLELCKTISLDAMTIKDLLRHTGVSRQTFYNHFRDKEDLITYIYVTRVLGNFAVEGHGEEYYENTLSYYRNVAKYHQFMKQACKMSGQGCLRDFMTDWSIRYDRENYERLTGMKPLPPELEFAARYHSTATISSCIAWVLSDMPVSPETLANQLVQLRDMSLSGALFGDSKFHQTKTEE